LGDFGAYSKEKLIFIITWVVLGELREKFGLLKVPEATFQSQIHRKTTEKVRTDSTQLRRELL